MRVRLKKKPTIPSKHKTEVNKALKAVSKAEAELDEYIDEHRDIIEGYLNRDAAFKQSKDTVKALVKTLNMDDCFGPGTQTPFTHSGVAVKVTGRRAVDVQALIEAFPVVRKKGKITMKMTMGELERLEASKVIKTKEDYVYVDQYSISVN